MKVADLSIEAIRDHLNAAGLLVAVGPFTVRLRAPLSGFAGGFARLYADHPVASEGFFADFHITLTPAGPLRRWWRPQVLFYLDEHAPFKPLPVAQAQAFFEWGLNWCIANHVQEYLVVHAAVVEKGGYAAVLPGPPGSGKSTLCTALTARGWRLLSDELALLDARTGDLVPLPRPVGLKNASIDRAQALVTDAVLDGVAADTRKGTVALLKPSRESVERAAEPARPAWVVIPRYGPDAGLEFSEVSAGEVFLSLVESAFNYPVLGETGFHLAADTANRCEGLFVQYRDAAEAAARLDTLLESGGAPPRAARA